MTKTYLVTGGAGFIGSNIVRKLVSLNKKVVVFTENHANLWRLQDVLKNIEVVDVDITIEKDVFAAIKKIKPNVIFHLAAIGVQPHTGFKKQVFDVNFFGTINLINACKTINFDCFIHTGSAVEYGQTTKKLTENLPLHPYEDYGVSKAATTLFCLKEALAHNLPIYTVRPFCVYGEYEMSYRLVPSIFLNGIQKKLIHLSEPHFVRDFIYVQDVVNFYLTLAEKRPSSHFVFNIGTGIQHSINDVVIAAQKLFEYPLKIAWNSTKPRPWEFENSCAQISLAKKVLNWEPKYSLEQGIKKSFHWFNTHIDLYKKES